MRINWQYALIAMALAVFSWYQVSGRERVETWVELPLEVISPPRGLVIQQGLVNRVQVRVRGPRGLIRRQADRDLAYTLPLAGLKVGRNVIELDPAAVPVSRALQVVEINPQRLMLTVDKLVSKSVPVKPVWTAARDADFQVLKVAAEPGEVILSGPESLLADISLVQTDMIEFTPRRSGLWDDDVGLSLPLGVESAPPRVQVEAAIEVKTKDMWLKAPFRLAAWELRSIVRIDPPEIKVRASIPLPLLRHEDVQNQVYATLRLPKDAPPGAVEVPFDVVLPEGCELIETKPATARVLIKAPD